MNIYYLITGLSLFFIAIGFIITKRNAKYLLSGYNTMNETQRAKVDIEAYITFFKRFHIFLGISLFIIGATLQYFMNTTVSGIFIGVYPILAYTYLILKKAKYSKGINQRQKKLSLLIIIIVFLFMGGILIDGFRDNNITFTPYKLEINGDYGETLQKKDIAKITIVNQLPKIAYKTNAFALGSYKKGYFKTKNGEIVKMFINANNGPYILFLKQNGEKIYYSTNKKSLKVLLSKIKKHFPQQYKSR